MISNGAPPLSPGWAITTVSDVTDDPVDQGGPPSGSDFVYIDIGSIDTKSKKIAEPKRLRPSEAPSRARQRVRPDDVVVSMTRPNLNAVAIVPDEIGLAIASTGFHVLRSRGVRPAWLFFLVQTNAFVEAMTLLVQGALYPAVRPKDVRAHTIPVAPLLEQDRIVAEIEKQFTRLDAGVAALERARVKLKRYRAAVLKAACEGRLVPTEAALARAEGRDYEPASVLLESIAVERRKRSEPSRRTSKSEESLAQKTEDLSRVPEGWTWSTFGELFAVFVGATPSRGRVDFWGGSIPWVSSGEVAFRTIRSTREKITETGLRNTSTEVHPPGTVLLGMIGEGKTRGQAAILGVAACNNQNSAAIRVSEAGLPPEYVFRYLEGQYEQTRQLGSGNNQPALNKSRVQAMVMPLPPLGEQHRIVEEVERRLSVVETLERAVAHGLVRAGRLRQAILRRAFEGKLAPQDPNDEPASVLLERIRAERAAAPPSRRLPNKRARAGSARKQTSSQMNLFGQETP